MTVRRFKCKCCEYIYSPLRGEPHNGIPAGTEFEDLPEDYVCALCGMQGKGRIGTGASRSGSRPSISAGTATTSTTRSAANPTAGSRGARSSPTSPTTTAAPSARSTNGSSKGWARSARRPSPRSTPTDPSLFPCRLPVIPARASAAELRVGSQSCDSRTITSVDGETGGISPPHPRQVDARRGLDLLHPPGADGADQKWFRRR